MDATVLNEAGRTLEANVPEAVRGIARALSIAGFRCWLVGGSVRDVVLATYHGATVHAGGDWDLASDARPEQVKPLFKKVLPTGIEHGTVTIVLGGQHYELTTLRGERGFSDGRRPDEVFFVDDIVADLARRDFTVNAIAFDLSTARFVDPFDGVGDLERNSLRAVGEPVDRFEEDGLRVLRAARFCATLAMDLEDATRRAIRPSLGSFRKVSLERVRDEWWKALKSARPSACFRVQRDEGLLEITAPELTLSDELWPRLDSSPTDPVLRMALLIIDGTSGTSEQKAEFAERLGQRLRLSNVDRARLVRLVRHAAPRLDADGAALRRELRAFGRKDARDVLDSLQFLGQGDRADATRAFVARALVELETGHALEASELAIGGRDLIAQGLITPGPELGRVLAQLLERVLEAPELNQKDDLLALATELCRV